MEALYDKSGKTVAFLGQQGRIISLRGQSLAWIKPDGNIYDYSGQHKGRWEGNHMRGPDGGVMFYTRNANFGITKPLPTLPPLAPLASLEPLRPFTSLAPLPPMKKMGWSSYILSGT